MTGNRTKLAVAAQIRTIGFLLAMIPLLILVALACVLSLVLVSPLIVYAAMCGKHLKDPWKRPHLSAH